MCNSILGLVKYLNENFLEFKNKKESRWTGKKNVSKEIEQF